MSTSLGVSLPNDLQKRPAGGFPAVYCLHGLNGDHTSWARRSSLDRYASGLGVAAVMPEVQRSFYSDMKYGLKYFTYVTEELPRLCAEMFGLSAKREDTFVMGYSMGGYGALKCAFLRPDIFSACAALSPCIAVETYLPLAAQGNNDMVCAAEVFGMLGDPPVIGRDDSPYDFIKKTESMPQKLRPRVLTCCGTEDFLYHENADFRDRLRGLPIQYTYFEDKGIHDWDFWDPSARKALKFLLRK